MQPTYNVGDSVIVVVNEEEFKGTVIKAGPKQITVEVSLLETYRGNFSRATGKGTDGAYIKGYKV